MLLQGKITLNTVEVLHGKLNHIAPLAPPLKLYMGELVQQLREFLKYQEEERDPGTRYKAEFEISATLVADLQVVLAILKDTRHTSQNLDFFYPKLAWAKKDCLLV